MGRLRRYIEKTFDRDGRAKEITSEDRAGFITLATSLLGRDATTAGSTFDDEVREAIRSASEGAEAFALGRLATSIQAHRIPIRLDELSAFARIARRFDADEDTWAFIGAFVQR